MIKQYLISMRNKFNGWFNFVLAAGMGFFVITAIVNIISTSQKLLKKEKPKKSIRLID